MPKTCKTCANQFETTQEEIAFLDKISPTFNGTKYQVPEPTLCSDCRRQRRFAFRNERSLHKRKCDLTGREIISVYSPDIPHKVYDSDEWWGDTWDATEYGREFDFNRPFFEQFADLLKSVPLLKNNVFNSTNSDYNSFCVDSKDCYMSARIGGSENIVHSYLVIGSTGCYDCMNAYDDQYCYECIDTWNCYECKLCQLCKNCSDCTLCYDCIGCKNCFGSTGLRNCEYYFFNKKYTKEEYEKLIAEQNIQTHSGLTKVINQYKQILKNHPQRATYIQNCENCTGDYITNSKKITNCFDTEVAEDVADSWGVEYSKKVSNCDYIYKGENCYENIANARSSNIFFSFSTHTGSHNLWYCMQCYNNTQDCFGCVSLKQKRYCILNKQYSKEQYEELVPRIIEHMIKTGEWGQFFPMELSTFDYSESIAQQYFPREETKQKSQTKVTEKVQIPDDIKDVDESIIQKILSCEVTGEAYKITPQEYKFYKQQKLPIPRKSPNQRYMERFAKRNPHKLYERTCDSCKSPIKSSIGPEQPTTVFCEQCYQEAVY